MPRRMAHVGLRKVIENISRVYWFPDMKNKVRRYIDNCLKCIEFSNLVEEKKVFYLVSRKETNRLLLYT